MINKIPTSNEMLLSFCFMWSSSRQDNVIDVGMFTYMYCKCTQDPYWQQPMWTAYIHKQVFIEAISITV